MTREISRIWYRSLTPDGNIWAESSDPADMYRPGPPGVKLTYEKQVTYIDVGPWEPYDVPEDQGGLS